MARDLAKPEKALSGEVLERSDPANMPAQEQSTSASWDPAFFARFGTFILVCRKDDKEWLNAGSRLEKAFGSDNRVAEVHQVEQSSEWTSRVAFYVGRGNKLPTEFVYNRNKFYGIELSRSLIFKIRVPIKNQPPFKDSFDIPSDSYWVAWNGVVCVVAWPTKEKKPPRSGGHVVIDVLRDAAAKAGFGFYMQACAPGCSNLFAHPVIGVELCTKHAGTYRDGFRTYQSLRVAAHVHADPDGKSVVERVSYSLKSAMRYFAPYKNYARYIIDLEGYAREAVDKLLTLEHANVERMGNSAWRRTIQAKAARKDRLKTATITSSLWIVLAEVEAIKRDWLAARRNLEEKSAEWGAGPLLTVDKSGDDETVLSLDLGFVRAAVEHSAAKFDSSRLILITLICAILALGGGIAGAVIGAMMQNAN